MRKAVIDLGTNTFNLLIADTLTQQILFQTKEGVALGMGGINKGILSSEAMERAFDALTAFHAICQEWQVQQIHAIGTSALRDASNAEILLQRVQRDIGLKIQIISGLQEAQLIYAGVKQTHHFNEAALIMDIGGGSTEFIAADNSGPYISHSFNIGVSRLFQLFDFEDPLSSADISKVEHFLAKECGAFFKQQLPRVLIGASGSFETFFELLNQKPFASSQIALEVSRIDFEHMLNAVIASTQLERDANSHIISIRKKMAPLAAIKTRWVLRQTQIDQIYISPYSLKEGVLFS